MDSVSQKDIDWLLDDPLSKEAPKRQKKSGRKRSPLRFLSWPLLIVALAILPFFMLIRTSVYLNLAQGWNGWLSLAGGIGVTVMLLLVYLFFLFRRVKNKRLLFKFSITGAGMLVLSFCVYGLMYLSSVNAKSDEIRVVYRSLHPILRVAVATTTLADSDLVITDISREPEDYIDMGLTVNQSSLHFKQNDGYVHAIDLRTIGRSEWRNTLLEFSLRTMGFKTIRHVGTADHLHISLPLTH